MATDDNVDSESKLGSLLIKLGLVSESNLNTALNLQQSSQDGDNSNTQLGYSSLDPADRLSSYDPKLGTLLIQLGYLSSAGLKQALNLQQEKLNQNAQQSDNVEVKDVKISLFKSVYMTVGSLVTVIALIGAGIWSYLGIYLEGQKLKNDQDNKIEILNKRVSDLGTEINDLKKTIRLKENQIRKSITNGIPKPTTSINGPSIISPPPKDGKPRIKFEWLNPNKLLAGQYFVKIRKEGSRSPIQLKIDPNKGPFSTPLKDGYGGYSWRIVHISGKQSLYEEFYVYPSSIDRIKETNTIIVGTTSPSEGIQSPLNGNTLEGNLLKVINDELKQSLKLEQLTTKVRYTDWNSLLNEVRLGSVDIAIGGITKTKDREQKYLPLRFSNPYLTNHQMFVSSVNTKPDEYPRGLKNKKVAIQRNTINLEAAKDILADKYNFSIVETDTYLTAYTLLNDNEVDFALVDSAYFGDQENHFNVERYGPYLDEELHEFYKDITGIDEEHYAIAVHAPEIRNLNGKNILEYINEILEKKSVLNRISKI